MTTAGTIVIDAFIEARISDPVDGPSTEEAVVGLRFLNRIIGRLSTQNILLPYSTSESFNITSSTNTYTMGSGGTASSSRARKITNAFVRDTSGYDSGVRIISEKDWDSIPNKNLPGKPKVLFYDPLYATGYIYLYPYPNDSYSVHIQSMKDLHASLGSSDTVSLPSEYEDALVLTLATKLSRAFGSPVEQSLYSDAQSAWKAIANLNLSQRVPIAVLPFNPSGSASDLFQYTDSFPYTFDFILA